MPPKKDGPAAAGAGGPDLAAEIQKLTSLTSVSGSSWTTQLTETAALGDKLLAENIRLKTALAKSEETEKATYVYSQNALAKKDAELSALTTRANDLQNQVDRFPLELKAAAEAAANFVRDELKRVQAKLAEREAALEKLADFRIERDNLMRELDETNDKLRKEKEEHGHDIAMLQRANINDREHIRGVLLERLREAKASIISQAAENMTEGVKRLVAENDAMLHELSYQSKQAERLAALSDRLQEENSNLRRDLSIAEGEMRSLFERVAAMATAVRNARAELAAAHEATVKAQAQAAAAQAAAAAAADSGSVTGPPPGVAALHISRPSTTPAGTPGRPGRGPTLSSGAGGAGGAATPSRASGMLATPSRGGSYGSSLAAAGPGTPQTSGAGQSQPRQWIKIEAVRLPDTPSTRAVASDLAIESARAAQQQASGLSSGAGASSVSASPVVKRAALEEDGAGFGTAAGAGQGSSGVASASAAGASSTTGLSAGQPGSAYVDRAAFDAAIDAIVLMDAQRAEMLAVADDTSAALLRAASHVRRHMAAIARQAAAAAPGAASSSGSSRAVTKTGAAGKRTAADAASHVGTLIGDTSTPAELSGLHEVLLQAEADAAEAAALGAPDAVLFVEASRALERLATGLAGHVYGLPASGLAYKGGPALGSAMAVGAAASLPASVPGVTALSSRAGAVTGGIYSSPSRGATTVSGSGTACALSMGSGGGSLGMTGRTGTGTVTATGAGSASPRSVASLPMAGASSGGPGFAAAGFSSAGAVGSGADAVGPNGLPAKERFPSNLSGAAARGSLLPPTSTSGPGALVAPPVVGGGAAGAGRLAVARGAGAAGGPSGQTGGYLTYGESKTGDEAFGYGAGAASGAQAQAQAHALGLVMRDAGAVYTFLLFLARRMQGVLADMQRTVPEPLTVEQLLLDMPSAGSGAGSGTGAGGSGWPTGAGGAGGSEAGPAPEVVRAALANKLAGVA